MRRSLVLLASTALAGCPLGDPFPDAPGGTIGPATEGDAGDVGSADDGAGDGDDTGEAPGEMVTVHGTVRSRDGGTIPFAQVTSPSGTTETDAEGTYSLTVGSQDASLVLGVAAEGHAPQVVRVPMRPGVVSYSVPITMAPMRSVVLAAGQSQVELPAEGGGRGGLLVLDEPVGADISIGFAVLAPEDGPGELRGAGTEPGLALQSGAMFWLEMDAAAPLAMPAASIVVDVDGVTEIPEAEAWQAWALDGDGLWASPSPATPTPEGTLAFPVPPEFGFWNADRNFRTACVTGRLTQPSGECAGGRVRATGPDGLSSIDSSGADGEFCVMGAQTFGSTLTVGAFSTQIQMPSSAGDCSVPESCADLGDLEVPEGTCDDMVLGDVGDPCLQDGDCVPGSVCFNEYCVGAGALRISLGFSVDSDFDLHVVTPLGSEIYFGNASADGGVLDVDQCIGGCGAGAHAENVVFADSAPPGTYMVFVVNFDGRAGGSFDIEVDGEGISQSFSGDLPASSGAVSQSFSFSL